MSIKIIALDMDGTLLNSNNQIDENLISVLTDLRSANVNIVLATGRTEKEIKEILPADFPYDGGVTSNGMGCFIEDKKIFQNYLDEDLVEEVMQNAQGHDLFYQIHSSDGMQQTLKDDYDMIQKEVNKDPPPSLKANELYSINLAINEKISWVNELKFSDVVKLYYFSIKQEKINNWKQTLEQLKQTKSFSTSSSSLHNVEVMKKNVSKATGLTHLLDYLDVSSDALMAIGDGENDLSMFELSSFPVAMKNAPDIVKNQAREVTEEDYDNQGLYLYLKTFIEKHLKR